MTDTAVKEAVNATKEQLPYVEARKPRHTGVKLLGILVVWLVAYVALQGKWTKALGLQDTTDLHRKLNEARDWVQLEGQDNWFIGGVLGAIGDALNSLVQFFQELISIPAPPRPVPEIGWLGVIAIMAWLTFVAAGLRSTILVTLSFIKFVMVVGWFMHLKFDHVSFTWYFGGGLVLALATFSGLVFLQIATHGPAPGNGNAHTFPPSLAAPASGSSGGAAKPAGGH